MSGKVPLSAYSINSFTDFIAQKPYIDVPAESPPPYDGPAYPPRSQSSSPAPQPPAANLSAAGSAAVASILDSGRHIGHFVAVGMNTVVKPAVKSAVARIQDSDNGSNQVTSSSSFNGHYSQTSGPSTASVPGAWQPSSPHYAAPVMQSNKPVPYPAHINNSPHPHQRQISDHDSTVSCYSYRNYMIPGNWSLILYFIVFNLPFALIAFAWCVATTIICSILFIIPPAGILFTKIFAYTWALFGRAELHLLTHATGYTLIRPDQILPKIPPLISSYHHSEQQQEQGQLSSINPHSLQSTRHNRQKDNCCGTAQGYDGESLISDFAWRSALYFTFFKMWVSLFTLLGVIVTVVGMFPLALFLGGMPMSIVITLCKFNARVSFFMLLKGVRWDEVALKPGCNGCAN